MTPKDLADADAALAALEAFFKKYGVALTPEERHDLPKVAPESRALATDSLALAEADNGFLPRNFEVGEFRKDGDAYDLLAPRLLRIARLSEAADDTGLALRSDLYTQTLTVYSYGKGRASGPGMDRLMAAFGTRFNRRRRPRAIRRARSVIRRAPGAVRRAFCPGDRAPSAISQAPSARCLAASAIRPAPSAANRANHPVRRAPRPASRAPSAAGGLRKHTGKCPDANRTISISRAMFALSGDFGSPTSC